MSRTISTALIAGTALGFGGLASAQSFDSTLSLSEAYRAELAADAAARASNLENGRSGFQIAAADGVGTLNVGGLVQFRYTANFRDEDATDGFDPDDTGPLPVQELDNNDFTHGFNVQRTRLDFYGNVLIPNFTYRISADFNSAVRSPFGLGGGVDDLSVTYAYGEYAFEGGLEGLSARLGLFKLPLLYEELVAPEYQLAAERSLSNEFFSQQYSEGLMFTYASDAWRANFAVSDGLGTAASGFNTPFEADVALTGRFDFKFAGDWEQFEDFTSFRGSEYAARAGAAVHWETFGDTTPDSTTRDFFAVPFTSTAAGSIPGSTDGNIIRFTADVQAEGNGWNFFAAFLGNYEESDDPVSVSPGIGVAFDEVTDFGVVVQGGFFATDDIEVFARYDGIFLDDDRFDTGGLEGEEDLHFGTFGVNYYFVPESHALKFTVDVNVAFEETSSLLATDTGLGVFGGSTGASNITGFLGQDEDTEIAVRAQFQLLF